MSHLPGTGVCQGNFAASVKEILPIHECGALAIVVSCGRFAHKFTEDSGH
jgi:hypothetical protein